MMMMKNIKVKTRPCPLWTKFTPISKNKKKIWSKLFQNEEEEKEKTRSKVISEKLKFIYMIIKIYR